MLALLSVVFALTLGVQAFINPIIPGFNPDPTLLVVGDDYFISTSTFEFFPGHPIYHSKDLVDWKLIGHALNRPSQLQLYGGAPESGAWAPTLRHYNGTFYLLTTVRRVYTSELRQQSRSYYVTTNDIFSNHWSDPLYIDGLGYDPDLLIDDDGTAYITRTDINNPVEKIYGIYQSIIDLPSGRTLSDTLIFNGTLPNNSTSRPEGPHLYKKGSYYYLILAEGGSSVYHRSTIVRSRNPSGPWEECPNNPLIYNGENPDPTTQPVQWTGHSDIAQLPDGSWWGVCLAVRPQGGNISRAQLGRESFLFPVQWGADDWPTFNNAEPLGLSGPGLRNRSYEESSFRDDFDTTKLDESYYSYSLDDRPGHLRLWGQALSLGDRDTPSVIFRKQVAFNQLFQTELDFQPQTPKQEAGLTVFYSDFYHQEIGITRHPADGSRCIVWRSRLNPNNTSPAQVNSANASLVHEEYYPIEATGPVTLAIQSENVRYNFGYGTAGGNVTYIGSVDALQVFTSPINYFLFKGVHFGIYSQGGERVMVNTPADFAYLVQETYAPDPS